VANRRYVRESSEGGWEVIKEGHRRATAYAKTKQGALARARAIARREGGGEIQVTNQADKVVSSATVTGRSTSSGSRSSLSSKREARNYRSAKSRRYVRKK
jgi:hypothetical protein